MDIDDPRPSADPVAALAAQDLGRLSIDELHARIVALDAEVARTRARIDAAQRHRAGADAIFR